MKKWNYYNDNDPHICEWVRRLIKRGLVPDGEVDGRSIIDIQPEDVRGFRQCHFFCGILGWVEALRIAGWRDDRRIIWTGSPPCQPFSIGGEKKGTEDHRDLWPDFYRIVGNEKPDLLFGEQVADAIAYGWFDRLADDMEAIGYAVGAAVLPACVVGASHRRNRIFWMADANSERWSGHQQGHGALGGETTPFSVDGNPLAGARRALAGDYGDLLPCDGLCVVMERRAVHGYGNSIVPQVAAEFIRAYLTPTPPGAAGKE